MPAAGVYYAIFSDPYEGKALPEQRWSRVSVAAILLAGMTGPGHAQQEMNGGGDQRTRIEDHVESTYTVRLEAPQQKQYCQANAAIEYLQHDTIASVSGTISNNDCAASSGTYTVTARIRGANGEIRDLEFEGEWARDDDRPVRFAAEYPIGANVDLLRVRPSGLRCICTEEPAVPDGDPAGAAADGKPPE